MTKNTLVDLNNHLFEEMERLNDDSLSDEELNKEVLRSKAMTNVGDKIIQNANVMLKAKVAYDDINSADSNGRSQILLGDDKDDKDIHEKTK
ncbi:hypothetical protein [Companilactobacillus bobalius]|uniref:Phage protein n=2 Tax=Companilactobacillus bobalius TaxID=2801451 RepID=A0A202F7X7_9LACO|nr:hypothetical protein [Companilactobacillus bobalius]GEO58495.1 hypothetical protein LBO01_16240 [Companilactobacillus paralimentarius]KAE9557559.1 hypothetical protein ATN92_15505 [Companilactobacillus bobalius]KAE9563705.1 hypothetical protein ATN92_02955 [Companilactobacillus bobalius]KRK83449.1 hypothetical protein FC78_GL001405 [Companilactobacillus bobalius DSM 19674]OVE96530.1 hypothetical protein LKACC16343_02197 [Companilactobacillus bobalius]